MAAATAQSPNARLVLRKALWLPRLLVTHVTRAALSLARAGGKDGFGIFKRAKVVVDSEHIAIMPFLIRAALLQQYKLFQAELEKEGAVRDEVALKYAARAVVDGRIVNTAEPEATFQ